MTNISNLIYGRTCMLAHCLNYPQLVTAEKSLDGYLTAGNTGFQ